MKRAHSGDVAETPLKQWAFDEEEINEGDDEEEGDEGDWECDFEGCGEVFTCMEDYEEHYQAEHRNLCSECGALFDSNFFLEVHFEESHDDLFQVLSEKKKSFICLDTECGLLFWTPTERSHHMRTAHVDLDSSVLDQFSLLQVSAPATRIVCKVPSIICFGKSDDD